MTRISEEFTARDREHHSNKKIEVNTRRRHLEGPARGFVSEGLASHDITFFDFFNSFLSMGKEDVPGELDKSLTSSRGSWWSIINGC